MNARTEPLALQPASLWSVLAKQWRVIDVPLRPCDEDIVVYEAALRAWQQAHPERVVRGLLLGVTAEIATMRWPEHASFVAVDHSLPMVANVWPQRPNGSAVCADWRHLPLAPHSRDIAIGDGCLTLLSVPQGRDAFARSLRTVLTEDGMLVLRCFCRPETPESPQHVFAELAAGRIRGFHAFKWRLAMSLHADPVGGVRLADVWDCWSSEVADPDAFAERCAWPCEAVRSMEMYRGSETRYMFATAGEVRAALAPWFALESRHVGGYELAERCPILVFRPA